jgi:hypothetical protein
MIILRWNRAAHSFKANGFFNLGCFLEQRQEGEVRIRHGLHTARFKWALRRDMNISLKWMLTSRTTRDLKCLYDLMQQWDTDLAIGNRYIKGVNVVNWPILLSYRFYVT